MKDLKKAYIIGTCDTKYPDLAFVRDILKEVASHHPQRKELLTNNKGRGDYVTADRLPCLKMPGLFLKIVVGSMGFMEQVAWNAFQLKLPLKTR